MFKRGRRITVAGSGEASAPGGVAITGVHIGDVNLRTGTPVRTHYRHQVQRIAPLDLEGRQGELDELATFCTSPAAAGTYTWWRAEAWSGKTALMSWFVLHPPAGVRLVSFFITARYAAQNDRNAFIENLTEQLLALLGQEWPPGLGRSRYESNLLGLLTEAAEVCSSRGEQFVLLVDGLDEDRGVHVGPDSHSIAALLPSTLPAGMRVIVTGRPHPPIPADVPAHHPLRDGTIVRTLEPSPRAQAIRVEMERDLKRLLEGTDAEQDLLGFVAAAGGGLSATDLAELTKESQWRVDEHLRSVTGRSFSVRDSHARPGGRDVYLLGHEEIQITALEMLGPDRLDEYRQRLHEWAERYRAKRWPLDTPEYLLRGYFNMLTATGDLTRMVACVTDPHRQNRMLDLSGGDAVALTEIGTTQDVVAGQDDPDLCAMVRLAIHRDHLADRNSEIPIILPEVWARLGHLNRAESIANSITDPIKRIKALTLVATAAAESGDRNRAARLVGDAEQIAHTIAELKPGLQAYALARIAGAAAEVGDFDRAEHLARTVTDHPNSYADALARTAGAAMKAGDFDRAEDITRTIITRLPHDVHALAQVAEVFAEAADFDRAEQIAHTITHRYWRTKALVRVAETVAKAGDFDRAERLARTITDIRYLQAEALARVAGVVAEDGEPERAARLLNDAKQIARTITRPNDLENVLQWIAESLAKAGDFDRAEQTANTITYTHPPHRTETLTRVAEAVAKAGDFARAEHLARTITYPPSLAEALARVAGVVAKAGESGRATRLLNDAEQAARTDTLRRSALEALARVAGSVAEAGDFDRAEHIARTITSFHWQANALARLAGAVAKSGDFDRAELIARTITDRHWKEDARYWKTEALTRVAEAVALAGDFERAEHIAHTMTESYNRVDMLVRIAGAAAKAGDFERAEHIAHTITDDPTSSTNALVRIAEAAAEAGDFDRAEHIAHTMTDGYWKVKALAGVAGVVAEADESGRATRLVDDAEHLARTITERFEFNRVNMLVWAAEAGAKAGESGRAARLLEDAEHIAHTIDHTYSRADALARVAEALAKSGDFDRAERIAHTITLDRSHRAKALVALAQNRSFPHRKQVVADVLRLEDWQLSVDVLTELAPTTPEVILTELAAVGLRGSRLRLSGLVV